MAYYYPLILLSTSHALFQEGKYISIPGCPIKHSNASNNSGAAAINLALNFGITREYEPHSSDSS